MMLTMSSTWLRLTASLALILLPSLAYDTPEDCRVEGREGGVFLSCTLSSINSRLERTNFSVIPSDRTLGLRVSCQQPTLGSLEPKGFASLNLLEELVIDGCAFESIPADTFQGLVSLRKLTVRTRSLSVVRVETGVFDHLANLTHLDFSSNSIRALPAGEICKLTNLVHLNMSGNEIGSIADLGLTQPNCLPSLDTLDLSGNEITSLDNNALPAVRQLSLRNNYIRFIAPDALANSSVQILDLSNNQISHLPPNIFHQVALQQLNLANNTLSTLSNTLLHGQKELELLDLSGNLLLTLHLVPSLTVDLVNLMDLDLSKNQLDSLAPGFLANLPNLKVLRLTSNRIKSIQLPNKLHNLKELYLADNLIKQVQAGDLDGFLNLSILSLAENSIDAVHPAVFRNASNILVLDMSNNRLDQVPDSLKYLANLQTLDVGGNRISRFADSPLSVMESLWRLQMPGNLLQDVSHDSLSGMKSLQILDLSRNRIGSIVRGAFHQNKLLRAVRLDGNQVNQIDGIFTHLPDLIWLNVSDNLIQGFDYTMVPRTLHWLDISHNQITELGNYLNLDTDLDLNYLHAGFNRLTSLAPHNLPDQLETVLLNDNDIKEVQPYTFFKKSNLVKVDLSVNEISSLTQTSLRLSSEVADSLPTFMLGGNPILCDCGMQWFKTINEKTSLQNYPVISDLESIYCRLVYSDVQSFIPLVEAKNEQFLCSYQTHCFSLCQCCQFDSCDCEMTCPDGCSCYHDNSWTQNIIQCSSGQYNSLPDNIPMDATELYLDGNNFSLLRSHIFIGRKNLRTLHLNNSAIERIENQTFNGLKSLTTLHLENNNLQKLQGFEFSGLPQLRELYLQGNRITSIHNATFKILHNLEIIFLQDNSLINFPVWELAFNPYLVSIRLAENLWSCECNFMNKFSTWIKGFGKKVYDGNQVTCVSNEPAVPNMLVSEYDVAVCKATQGMAVAKTQVQEKDVKDYMPMMIAMLASFALVILLAMTTFIFRDSIKVWVHSKYGVRMFESLESKTEAGKLFDAYLSYSTADEAFVRQLFAPQLETENGYRLCLHHRDLPANTVTSDTVLRASEAAQRTVVLLSNNFLRTEWVRYDYKSGLLQSVNNGSKKVVFVILGNLEGSLLDPNMRLLLKNNVVLHWGEQLFWEKIKYSLPDLNQSRGAQPQAPTFSTYNRSSGRGTRTTPLPQRNLALHI